MDNLLNTYEMGKTVINGSISNSKNLAVILNTSNMINEADSVASCYTIHQLVTFRDEDG